MAQLNARDLQAALAFVDEAHSFADLDSFRSGILPGLERLVPCDLVGYNEVYPSGMESLVITYPDPPLPLAGEALSRLAHQHPLIAVQANGDDAAYKISDFLSRREYHSLELYGDLYRHLEAEDQIAFGLPGPMVIGIAMNRDRRSFTERDRLMLDLLRPHLARAYTQLCERARLGELIAVLERGLAESGRAVIALAPSGDIAAASDGAIELLQAYLPETWSASLPPELTVRTDRGRLTVRRVDAGSDGTFLVLAEERAVRVEALRALGLTRRQAEVLRLLANGRGTDQVATDLFISPQTVRKHLEHIYARLGVTSRAAAVAAARRSALS